MSNLKKKINFKNIIQNVKQIKLSNQFEDIKNVIINGIKDIETILAKLDQIDQTISAKKNSFSAQIKKNKKAIQESDKDRALIFVEMEKMLVTNETIFNIQRQKILTLTESLFLLVEKDDLLSASVISRGIHEVVASFAHIYLYLNKRLKILYNQKDTKKIQKEIDIITKFFNKVFYSSKSSDHGFIHIDTARRDYQKYFPDNDFEESNYNRLSQYVHPNYGSNKLFGAGSPSEFQYSKINDHSLSHLLLVININTINLKNFDNILFSYSLKMIELLTFCRNILDTNIKIENIFSDQKINISKYKGDSFENAIELTKARSIFEQTSMISQVLNKMNLTEKTHQIHKFNHHLIHESKTEKGSIFFKLNIKLPPV